MNKIDKFKKFLKDHRYNNDITEEDGKIKVEGSLDLRETNITELPDNLTVEGSLYLRGTNITKLPDNITVGGWLDLSRTNIAKLPENITVGGIIYGFNIDNIVSIKKVLKVYNKELNYIYFDGILWGNVKSVKKIDDITIYKTPLGYCVVENNLSAHGKTLRQAMEDLTFKKMKNKNVSDIVAEIKKTGKVTRMQYRAITGACQFGTEQFCKQHNIEGLEEIELEELRKILISYYGAREFWKLIDG